MLEGIWDVLSCAKWIMFDQSVVKRVPLEIKSIYERTIICLTTTNVD